VGSFGRAGDPDTEDPQNKEETSVHYLLIVRETARGSLRLLCQKLGV